MLKMIGSLCVLGGTAGVLFSWIQEQKKRQMYLDSILMFLHKSLYVMQNEKIKVADYFGRYIEQEGNKKENNKQKTMHNVKMIKI